MAVVAYKLDSGISIQTLEDQVRIRMGIICLESGLEDPVGLSDPCTGLDGYSGETEKSNHIGRPIRASP